MLCTHVLYVLILIVLIKGVLMLHSYISIDVIVVVCSLVVCIAITVYANVYSNKPKKYSVQRLLHSSNRIVHMHKEIVGIHERSRVVLVAITDKGEHIYMHQHNL
jgi:hypothetical protein